MSTTDKDGFDNFSPFLFDAKSLAKDLREVSVDFIQTEAQDVKSRWFHSAKEIDIYIWFDEKSNIIKQQISFFGQLAEWNVIEGVRTGVVVEGESRPSMGSELVHYDEKPQKMTLNQALDLLQHTEAMEEELRRAVAENFVNSPHLSNIDPEEFLRRYGHVRKPTRKISLWQRLLALFSAK